jgi:hypothetical protein
LSKKNCTEYKPKNQGMDEVLRVVG